MDCEEGKQKEDNQLIVLFFSPETSTSEVLVTECICGILFLVPCNLYFILKKSYTQEEVMVKLFCFSVCKVLKLFIVYQMDH